MMSWKLAAIPIFLFVVSLAVPIVHAEGEVSLPEVPQIIADNFGTDLFIGQLIASAIIFAIVMFPIFIATKNKVAHTMMGILVLSICIGLGWVPIWIFAIMVLGVAFGFAKWAQKIGG